MLPISVESTDPLDSSDLGNLNSLVKLLPQDLAWTVQAAVYCYSKIHTSIGCDNRFQSPSDSILSGIYLSSFTPEYFVYSCTILDHFMWTKVLTQVREFPVDITRFLWKIYFSIYTHPVQKILDYCTSEFDGGNYRYILFLFESHARSFPKLGSSWSDLTLIPQNLRDISFMLHFTEYTSVALWLIYLNAAEKDAFSSASDDDVVWSRVHESYLYAKSVIGQALDSLPFWRRYIEFLNTRIHSSLEQKNIIRHAYQEFLMSPVEGISELIEEYIGFEEGLQPTGPSEQKRSVLLGADFKSANQRALLVLNELSSDATAKATFKDFCSRPICLLAKRCDTNFEATEEYSEPKATFDDTLMERQIYAKYFQSSYDESPQDIAMYMQWQKRIIYELSNPLELRFTSEVWIHRMAYVYISALENLHFHVDIWLDFARFLLIHRQFERAIHVYERALFVFPIDGVVRCVYADVLSTALLHCPTVMFPKKYHTKISPLDIPAAKQRSIQLFEDLILTLKKVGASDEKMFGAREEKPQFSAGVMELCTRLKGVYLAYIKWSYHHLNQNALPHITNIIEKLYKEAVSCMYLQNVFHLINANIHTLTNDGNLRNVTQKCTCEGWFPGQLRTVTKTFHHPSPVYPPMVDDFMHFSRHRRNAIFSFSSWCLTFETLLQKEGLCPMFTRIMEQIPSSSHTRKSAIKQSRQNDSARTVYSATLFRDPLIVALFMHLLGMEVRYTTGVPQPQCEAEIIKATCVSLNEENLLPLSKGTSKSFGKSPIEQTQPPLAIGNDITTEFPGAEDYLEVTESKETPLDFLLKTLPSRSGCLRAVPELHQRVPSTSSLLNILRSQSI